MGMEDVRDALDSVSKDNFGEFESTEWSIVMNLSAGEARYYHRENYEQDYTCLLYTSPSPRDTERSRMPSSA